MGAAPSRETHRRGIFAVRSPACPPSNGTGGRKQDIVLIPLTKEFFPSPDCPLFVQFHRARCDAAVSYYFRQPGNPGDLSRIPATTSASGRDKGDDSYPSREALYRGVVERVEEMLFDTDQEMYEAHVRATGCCSTAHSDAASPSSPSVSSAPRRRVLPVLCAVAFLYDPARFSHAAAAGSAAGASPLSATLLTAMEQGVMHGGYVVNIVGCFGFVPMDTVGRHAASIASLSGTNGVNGINSGSAGSGVGGSLTGRAKLLGPSRAGYTAGGFAEHFARVPDASHRSLGSSCASSPSYDPHRPVPSAFAAAAEANYDHFVSLPPPVAAPLAAIVFLTKSAGEQNLSRVTFIAASTYYTQLADAGLLPQRGKTHMTHSPYRHRWDAPPMDTFSFSCLMTNVPILSFVHEMRCRWGHLGFSTTGGSNGDGGNGDGGNGGNCSSRGSSLNGSMHSHPCASASVSCHNEMEMWLTDDNMLHGRIRKELAERLCRALAERPEVMAERVEVAPMDKPNWRFCGLVTRFKPPPPQPQSEGEETHVEATDVYVMGSAVMEGFDEGDVLRLDTERNVWVADRTIPLEAVVLAAMRPHCRRARVAPADDEGWVRAPVSVTEGFDEGNEFRLEEALPPAEMPSAGTDSGAQREACTAGNKGGDEEKENNKGKKEEEKEKEVVVANAERSKEDSQTRYAHVHEGNFYIYRFEINGTTYYHGTVPDFANPNKRRANQQQQQQQQQQPLRAPAQDGTPKPQMPTKDDSTTRPCIQEDSTGLPSIAAALFAAGHIGADTAAAYLPTRVTSAAIDTARRWMTSIVGYVGGPPFMSQMLAGPESPSSRRQPTFVEIGQDVQAAAVGQVEQGRGFVKRFVEDAKYMWDWRKSS